MSTEMIQDMPEVANDGQDGEAVNGNVLFSEEISDNSHLKDRVIKKAKRPSKASPRKEENAISNGAPQGVLGSSRSLLGKNSRRSRSGKGRGLPKKGGGGGKGVWGRLGLELMEDGVCHDSHDPNYDSDNQDNNVVVKKVDCELTAEEVELTVPTILKEYFEHGDTDEVAGTLEELHIREQRPLVCELVVSLAMDRHDPQREMASRLISDLYGRFLSQAHVAAAFDHLLANIHDLTIDIPEAPNMLGQFLARTVADDCLPPKYVTSYTGKVETGHARQALDKADVLLNMKHGIVRLDNVWGMGGGNRPVKYLTKRMVLLLKEYLSSGDISEATRCLKELEVPHFHHELVYEALTMAIEESKDSAVSAMVLLLKHQVVTNVITPEQFRKGILRVFEDMPDICLDVPTAYTWLDRLGNKMFEEKILAEDLYRDLPSRGRKRFVSEGDGGRIKDHRL